MVDAFSQHIQAIFGEEGKKWLEYIPFLIHSYEEKWNIYALDPFPLNYNYVTPVTLADGTMAVLKLGCPGNKEFTTEIEALKIFNGQGSVKLLKEDVENYAVLLERAIPGEQLVKIQQKSDEEATAIAVSVMQQLWKTAPENYHFPTVKDVGKAFNRYKEKFGQADILPKTLVDTAEALFSNLLASSANPVLLHGDLHYENMLSSSRGWLAIDPKGLIGEPAYDTGVLLRNPYPQLIKEKNAKAILRNRIDQLSELLDIDKKRIWGWGFSQAVLSAIWVVEDREQYIEYYLSCANLLSEISV